MVNYLIRRFFQMLLVVIISSMAIYFLLYLSPGGPLAGLGGQSGDRRNKVTAQDVERISQYLGLHRGPFWGYLAWLTGEDWMGSVPESLWPKSHLTGEPVSLQLTACQENAANCAHGVLRGDFGNSWQVARSSSVGSILISRMRNTFILMIGSTLLSLVVAIPIGIYSAVHQYSRMDYSFTTFSFMGTAMPVFWFGLMVIMIFGGNQSPIYKLLHLPYMPTGNVTLVRPAMAGSLELILGATPGSWLDIAVHAVLPTLVLSMLYMAGWSRFMRTAMLEVLRQDYVRTARAKGLGERVVIYRHALRNALIPLITIVVFQIPGIFGGATITETIFNWPGMGFLYIQAIQRTDYPVAMAFLFVSAVLVVIASLLGDILYTIVDPRIRFN